MENGRIIFFHDILRVILIESLLIHIVETKNSLLDWVVPPEACQLFVQLDRVHYHIRIPSVLLLIIFRNTGLIQFQANAIRRKQSVVMRRMLENLHQSSWQPWKHPRNILMSFNISFDFYRMDHKRNDGVVKRNRRP